MGVLLIHYRAFVKLLDDILLTLDSLNYSSFY
jgi:hypothetical protein